MLRRVGFTDDGACSPLPGRGISLALWSSRLTEGMLEDVQLADKRVSAPQDGMLPNNVTRRLVDVFRDYRILEEVAPPGTKETLQGIRVLEIPTAAELLQFPAPLERANRDLAVRSPGLNPRNRTVLAPLSSSPRCPTCFEMYLPT